MGTDQTEEVSTALGAWQNPGEPKPRRGYVWAPSVGDFFLLPN